MTDDDFSEKLKGVAEERGVFIGALCDEILDAVELGYECVGKKETEFSDALGVWTLEI